MTISLLKNLMNKQQKWISSSTFFLNRIFFSNCVIIKVLCHSAFWNKRISIPSLLLSHAKHNYGKFDLYQSIYNYDSIKEQWGVDFKDQIEDVNEVWYFELRKTKPGFYSVKNAYTYTRLAWWQLHASLRCLLNSTVYNAVVNSLACIGT